MAEPLSAYEYVEHALRLARVTPGGVVSAGQVAWHAHGKPAGRWVFGGPSGNSSLDLATSDALMRSGRFKRASFLGGRFGEIELFALVESSDA